MFGKSKQNEGLVQDIDKKCAKLLADNILPDEQIVISLPGVSKQALVITNKRLYIIKYFMSVQTCVAFEFKSMVAVKTSKSFLRPYTFQIVTAGNQDSSLANQNPVYMDNTLTFKDKRVIPLFQQAVNYCRDQITKVHSIN